MEDRNESYCASIKNCNKCPHDYSSWPIEKLIETLNKTIDELKQQKELNKSLKEEFNKEKGNIDQLYRTVLSFNKSKMRWW